MESGIIRVLPPEVVNKIAAGEVVERPASVVKELLENAVDAQSRSIEIEIKEGGQKLIEITDDGVGMTQADAVMAFTPHATSKIGHEEDLDRLSTLGFRGEALATIAAVSRVSLVTRHDTAAAGTRVQVDGGRILQVEPTSFPRGTRLQVKNLFFNVPARRKFLKSVQTEMAQISDIVCHYMMAYPEIAFRFTKGNIPLAHTTGSGQLLDAILAVYGPEVARGLIPLVEPKMLAGSGGSIRGFISKPNDARPSPRYLTTLINRRFVRSKLLSQAISKALSAFFPRGRYPVLVLDLRLPPDAVDVNVHPQKTEVRFRDERWIFGLVWETIQASLSGLRMVGATEGAPGPGFTPTPGPGTPGLADDGTGTDELAGDAADGDAPAPAAAGMAASPPGRTLFPEFGTPTPLPAGGKLYELKDSEHHGPASVPTGSPFERVLTLREPRILAQMMNAYLLGEDQEGMFVVDQHAAHERILFDTYVRAYGDARVASQPLLFPIPLKLLPSERMLLKDRAGELEDLGFAIQQEEDGQFYATAVPILGDRAAQNEVIQELLGQVLGGMENRTLAEIKTDLLKMMACKAAVKAGDPLKEPEMRSLLDQLLKTDNPFTCPHGRPVVLRLSRRQIEHGFLRC
ncbi:MAG: DNA mismatch repair endonuclease MutL [Candidatus Riflebacteria bacterium]|nr:DNA mismatch repair endonuclease MutL [Candidatus Riflebacteria bacterium]